MSAVNVKRAAALILAAVFLFALSVPVFAEGPAPTTRGRFSPSDIPSRKAG